MPRHCVGRVHWPRIFGDHGLEVSENICVPLEVAHHFPLHLLNLSQREEPEPPESMVCWSSRAWKRACMQTARAFRCRKSGLWRFSHACLDREIARSVVFALLLAFPSSLDQVCYQDIYTMYVKIGIFFSDIYFPSLFFFFSFSFLFFYFLFNHSIQT
jgi:hypothetical protein